MEQEMSEQAMTEQAMIGGILNNSNVDVDEIVRDVVAELMGEGARLVGLTQSAGAGVLPSRCAGMEVQFIGSDRRLGIAQELGGLATSCALDTSKLVEAAGIVKEAMSDDSDLMVLSRFGKSEADGGGLLDCASHAVASGVPVLMAISPKHVQAWRDYHGGLGVELAPDREAVASWCRSVIGE